MTQNSSVVSVSDQRAIPSISQLRLATATLILLLILAFAGAIAGPRWHPPQLHSPLQVASANTRTTDVPPPNFAVSREVIRGRFTSGQEFKAALYRPQTAAENLPAVVFMHGAGTGDHRWFEPHARALAAFGIVALVPDKPLADYSLTHRDYEKMAADYGGVVQLARAQAGVDASKVGVYAESEGGYVAPILAAMDPQLAFLTLVSVPVVTPRQQAAFATDNYLRNTFVPAPVFHNIPRMLGVTFPWGAFDYADFSTREYQRHVTCPVLMVYGTADASMPLIQAVEQLRDDISASDNDQLTVRYYRGANHGIKIDRTIVPEFLRDAGGWIAGLPATATSAPHIAGAQPTQTYRAITPPRAPWYVSGNMVVYTAIAGPLLAVAGFVIGAPIWLVGTLRARRNFTRRASLEAVRAARSHLLRLVVAAWLAILAAWTLYFAYLTSVASLAVNYQTSTVVVTGGWVFCHLTSIGAVAAFVTAVRGCWYGLRHRIAMPVGLVIITATTITATLLMFIVGAYWGLFSPLALVS